MRLRLTPLASALPSLARPHPAHISAHQICLGPRHSTRGLPDALAQAPSLLSPALDFTCLHSPPAGGSQRLLLRVPRLSEAPPLRRSPSVPPANTFLPSPALNPQIPRLSGRSSALAYGHLKVVRASIEWLRSGYPVAHLGSPAKALRNTALP